MGKPVLPNDWELEDGRIVRLITPAELAELPLGTALMSIYNEQIEVGRDVIDTDTRFGYLGYGHLLPQGE